MKMQVEVEVKEQQMRKLWSLDKAELLTLIGLVVLLLTLGAMPAAANSISNTIYCTGGSNNCFSSNAGLTSYWTITSNMTTNPGQSSFAYTLTISSTNESNPGFLQDFSAQFFFGGSQLTNLQWTANPGNWVDLSASKAGNSGTCQGNTPGAFCGSVDQGGTLLSLANTVTLGVSGNYTGTFLDSSGDFNFQMAAANNSDGSGGNAIAISLPLGAGGQIPDGGMTLMLLGGALVGLETMRRKFGV
jgi:hypothetical protein